jgi:hypothetical protein
MTELDPSMATIRRLGALRSTDTAAIASTADPVGVVSAYVNFAGGGQHRAETAVRRAVAALSDSPGGDHSHQEWSTLLDQALERLVEQVDVRPAAGERARAVFLPLSHGTGHAVRVASPLPDLVIVDRRPYLRPLLAAEAGSLLVGIVGVTHAGLTITEFWGEQSTAEWSMPLTDDSDTRRLQGPSRPRLGAGGRAEAQTDLLDRRAAVRSDRLLTESIGDLVEQIGRHAWKKVIVGGDVRDSRRVVALLGDAGVDALLHSQHVDSARERLAALNAFNQARVEGDSERVHELLAATQDGGPACVGAATTLEAIEQGRARLVLVGEPAAGATTALPASPLNGLGGAGLHDPLNDVALAAATAEVPLVTLAGDLVSELPVASVGALLRS